MTCGLERPITIIPITKIIIKIQLKPLQTFNTFILIRLTYCKIKPLFTTIRYRFLSLTSPIKLYIILCRTFRTSFINKIINITTQYILHTTPLITQIKPSHTRSTNTLRITNTISIRNPTTSIIQLCTISTNKTS